MAPFAPSKTAPRAASPNPYAASANAANGAQIPATYIPPTKPGNIGPPRGPAQSQTISPSPADRHQERAEKHRASAAFWRGLVVGGVLGIIFGAIVALSCTTALSPILADLMARVQMIRTVTEGGR